MEEYFKVLRNNLDGGRQSAYFKELIAALDAAYRTVIQPPPKGPLVFGRFLLICHKSMLSAATLIAQRQPEDSVGITRRAVEAARVALAIKLNDRNALQWTSYQERHDRWIKRQQGEKPKPFRVEFTDIKGEPLIDELDRWLGILSDAYVHFTPEFYDSLDWDQRIGPDGDGQIFLNYFHRDAREVERHFTTLAAVHGLILKAFDRCFDGGISGDPEKLAAVNEFWRTSKRFNDEYRTKYGTAPAPGLG
jgi:hypothetical protein